MESITRVAFFSTFKLNRIFSLADAINKYSVELEIVEPLSRNPLKVMAMMARQPKTDILLTHDWLSFPIFMAILKLACGSQYVLILNSLHARTMGIDFSGEMVQYANRNNAEKARFLQGDAEKLPFQDCHFTAVFALGVLGKFNTPEYLLEECFRVLEPEGSLLFIYPNTFSYSRVLRRWFLSLRNTNKKDNGLHLHSIESIKKVFNLLDMKFLA